MEKLVMERDHLAVRFTSLQLPGIFLIMAFLIISHTTVHAQINEGQPNFAIQPVISSSTPSTIKSYFVLSAKPGTTLLEKVRITNTGTATGNVGVHPVSATTAQASGIAYLSTNDPLRDAASWIKMDQQQLTLAPGQSQVVSFQLAIPTSARPGQHMGGITADNITPENSYGKGAIRINILRRSIIAVQINIAGPISEQMTVTGIKAGGSNGYQSLLVGMSNTGNQMLKPTGALTVNNAQGQLSQVLPLKLGIILPDTHIDYPVNLKKALTAGDYQVSLHLNYGHGKTLDYTTKLTITQNQVNQAFSNGPLQAPTSSTTMPLWQMILVALAALIILLMGGKKAYDLISARRRKQTKNGPTAPTDGSHQPMDTSKRRDKVA